MYYPDLSIVQLAKAPRQKQVKTRMQPVLTAQQCVILHCSLTELVAQQAMQVAPLSLYVSELHPYFQRFLEHGMARLAPQCGGDLGARLYAASQIELSRPQCRGVLLIGSDCPSLSAGRLAQAAASLDDYQAVLIPAYDGGYVLLGLRAELSACCAALFAEIDWGSERVASQTRQRLRKQGIAYKELEPLHDIDRPADLALLPDSIQRALSANAVNPSPHD